MPTTDIVKLTQKGLGADADGRLFLRALPGETVEFDQDDGPLVAPRVVTPSTDRVAAVCRHFKTCGGCLMQHASEQSVADWKTEIVRLGLASQGIETNILPILTSPPQTRRRAKFAARRTKKGAMIGFHMRGSDGLVAVPDCQLVTPSLRSMIQMLEEFTVEFGSRKGELALTVTDSLGGLDVMVENGKELVDAMRVTLAAAAGRYDFARLTWNDETIVTRRAPAHQFGKAQVAPPPGAFLQATKEGELALTSAVRNALGDASIVVDLFAGAGTFTIPMAETAQVHAVEGVADMLETLDAGWRMATGLKRVTTEARDLFRRPLLPDEFHKKDGVVIDPPRAGAEAQTHEIANSAVPLVASVSCNPVTFARDARILVDAGFALDWVQPVDQFRWSNHTEIAARFSR